MHNIVKLLLSWVIDTEVKHRLSISLRSFLFLIFIYSFISLFFRNLFRDLTLFEFSFVLVTSSNVILYGKHYCLTCHPDGLNIILNEGIMF